MSQISRREVIGFLTLQLGVGAFLPAALAQQSTGKLKIDVFGQFVDLLAGILKLAQDSVGFYREQKLLNTKDLKSADAERLAEVLTHLSYEIQQSLYNGSNPALQAFKARLEGPPPYDLESFSVTLKDLAQRTEATIKSLSEGPSQLTLEPAYGKLLTAQRKRLELFNRMPNLKGKATAKQASKMRVALSMWERTNGELEHHIAELNKFIKELNAAGAESTAPRK